MTPEEGHSSDDTDGPGDSEKIRQQPSQERPDGVSAITPEPVDTHCRGAPVRVDDISNCREQCRIDQSRPQPKQTHRERPPPKPVEQRQQPYRDTLKHHPAYNHALAPNAV